MADAVGLEPTGALSGLRFNRASRLPFLHTSV